MGANFREWQTFLSPFLTLRMLSAPCLLDPWRTGFVLLFTDASVRGHLFRCVEAVLLQELVFFTPRGLLWFSHILLFWSLCSCFPLTIWVRSVFSTNIYRFVGASILFPDLFLLIVWFSHCLEGTVSCINALVDVVNATLLSLVWPWPDFHSAALCFSTQSHWQRAAPLFQARL